MTSKHLQFVPTQTDTAQPLSNKPPSMPEELIHVVSNTRTTTWRGKTFHKLRALDNVSTLTEQ